MTNTKIIGNRITEARKKINYSQAQLAAELFISAQAVGKWERGESMPDITTLNRLAKILGVDLNYFSDSFQSVATEKEVDETIAKIHDERSAENQKKKHSWNMSSASWVDADFSGLKNLDEKFSSSNIRNCKFIGSDMSGLLLTGNNVDGCDFSGSNISSSQIQNTQLANNNFRDCLLKEAEFSKSYIKNNDFSGSNLTEAIFKSSSLGKNTMTNALLKHTSFIASEIADLVIEGNLEDCYFENCAFSKVIFKNSTLTNTFFKGRKLKGIRFVNCQADRLTYEFLKNGKADLSGITILTT